MTGLEVVLYLLGSLFFGCIGYVIVKETVGDEIPAVLFGIILVITWPVAIPLVGIPFLLIYGFSRIYNKLTKRKVK